MDQEITQGLKDPTKHYAIHRNKETQKWLHQTLAASFRVTFWRPIMKPHVLHHQCDLKKVKKSVNLDQPHSPETGELCIGLHFSQGHGCWKGYLTFLFTFGDSDHGCIYDIVRTLSSWDSYQNRVPKDVPRYLRKCSAFRPKPKQSLGAQAAWLDLKLELKKLFEAQLPKS